MKPTNTLLPLLAALLIGCASTGGKNTIAQRPGCRPVWVDSHPTSSTHFIGVGSARTDGDPVAAQEAARMAALNDIAQQIEVTIVSDMSLSDRNVTVNNKVVLDQSVFMKKIQSLAQAVLQDWEIRATWNDPNGRVYCKVVLEKKKYYDRVNKKVNDAIALASDALAVSRQGPFTDRLRELYKGMTVLDDFPGNVLKATVNGSEVILNTELPRRLQQLLSGVQIVPAGNNIALAATAPIPDTLGAFVSIDGKPDPSIALSWSASASGIRVSGLPIRDNGLNPVSLSSLPASAGTVTITATPDCGPLSYDLLKRKFSLTSGLFTIRRQVPRIFLDGANDFSRQLLARLASRSAATVVASRQEADLVLSAQQTALGEPIQTMGIYRAKTKVTVILTAPDGKSFIDSNEEVAAADPQSGPGAQANAEKVALETAIKKVEGAF